MLVIQVHCSPCSLIMTVFYPAKFLMDSVDLSHGVYPFVSSFDASTRCACQYVSCCMDLFLVRPMTHPMHSFGAKPRSLPTM